jgi:DNA-binding CsgD family transcriptional regulator
VDDGNDGEEADMALIEAQFPEPTLVTILVDEHGCQVVEAQPVGSARLADELPCRDCRERLREIVADVTTVRSQPRMWALLTARERETAELAAAGLTNRGIAARLGTSVRTVENHLGRSYEKLGISGRTELRLLLAVAGDDADPTRHLEAVPERADEPY